MTTYAEQRRNRYQADVDNANAYYRESGDLAGFQERNRAAREEWERDITAHYADAINARRREFIDLHTGDVGERIYGTLDTGETVRIPSTGYLASVSSVTGSNAEPPAARLIGPLFVRNERDTFAAMVQPAN